jgi:hypothetical protein
MFKMTTPVQYYALTAPDRRLDLPVIPLGPVVFIQFPDIAMR